MILTYKYRIKDKSSRKKLRELAKSCNQVLHRPLVEERKEEQAYMLAQS